ncbi:MAG TPA: TetR/AcrR family transcriptional regulator [Gaiellaceae bacterium]
MTTQSKRRLTAGERRQDVLLAGCRVFASRSYRGATTAEIARESGISEPILYRHFGSKRDLYLACLDESWRRFKAEAESLITEDPHGCLGRIAEAYMQSQERVRLIDLWIQALSVAPEDEVIAKALREQIREVHDFFADVVRRGQELGDVLPDRDPVAEAWIFVASGLLATVDHRLGGLLGDDLQRVRTERKRWMTGISTE